jgi:hypothetical protein
LSQRVHFLRSKLLFNYCFLSVLTNCIQLVKSFRGGSETFFTSVWSTHISSFDTLLPHLRIATPSIQLQVQLDSALSNRSYHATFSNLLTSFLRGAGVPCPDLWNDAREHFNSIIDLTLVDHSGFRARMFCWAATGSSERAADASPISVSSINLYLYLFLINFARSASLRIRIRVTATMLSDRLCSKRARLISKRAFLKS